MAAQYGKALKFVAVYRNNLSLQSLLETTLLTKRCTGADVTDQEEVFDTELELHDRVYRRQRQLFASRFELSITALIWLLIILGIALQNVGPFGLTPIGAAKTLTSLQVLAASFYLFFVAIRFMLFGQTPIIAAIAGGSSFANVITGLIRNSPSDSSISSSADEEITKLVSKAADSRGAGGADRIQGIVEQLLDRAKATASSAQARPSALLLIGGVIALAGLFFFFFTLPAMTEQKALDIWMRLVLVTPRVLMLLFIQVLAGFFLRQYRSSMEEFRYYEAMLRRREEIALSYAIRKELNDRKLIAELAKTVLTTSDFSRLGKGETTTILEMHKNSDNEFDTLIGQLTRIVEGARVEKKKKSSPASS